MQFSNEDYQFGWTYLLNGTLPADTFMTCNWGDGSPMNPSNERFNLTAPHVVNATHHIFNVAHNFSVSGNYTVKCNMSNFVSNQELTHNITVYDRIVNLTALPKFFLTDTQATAMDPVGPGSRQLPLERNVSFYLNYTQGNAIKRQSRPLIAQAILFIRHDPEAPFLRGDGRNECLAAELHRPTRQQPEGHLRSHPVLNGNAINSEIVQNRPI